MAKKNPEIKLKKLNPGQKIQIYIIFKTILQRKANSTT